MAYAWHHPKRKPRAARGKAGRSGAAIAGLEAGGGNLLRLGRLPRLGAGEALDPEQQVALKAQLGVYRRLRVKARRPVLMP